MKRLLIVLTLFLTLQSYSQITLIPDANFEQRLIDFGYDSGPINGSVPTANINSLTILSVPASNISDLTGIQDFSALTYLQCNNNLLTSIDLTQNTALTELWCSANQLTSLDLTQNIALTHLKCRPNQLTSLDLTQNTALIGLVCGENALTSLDLTHNTALLYLFCHDNQLTNIDLTHNTALIEFICDNNLFTSLDLTQNPALTEFNCDSNLLNCINIKNGNNSNIYYFSAISNPDLTCIQVDDMAWSAINWTTIDAQTSFSTNCGNPCTLSINELNQNSAKKLSKIVDLTGREIPFKKNTMMIYIYEDGSSDRVIELE